jgi:hypothetical protein
MATIAWDVDDVLNDLMRAWFERAWLPAHPDCQVTYERLTANPPHEVLGTSREEYLSSLDAFRLAHARALEPSPVVRAWFERHGNDHRHLAITATPLHTSPISAGWVMEHFGRWIRTVSIIPSPRPFDDSKRWDATKIDHLRWLGRVDVLVDDTEGNVEGAEAAGIEAVLFPRPWNRATRSIEETLAHIARAPCGGGAPALGRADGRMG